MITLGIDTATSACACAVWSAAEGRIIAVQAEAMTRGQAERLIPLVQETLAAAGVGFAAIDRYAVVVGPGTFTGLRIGLAAARGLALAADKPLLGVTSLEAAVRGLDAGDRDGRTLLAIIESRRDELFVQPWGAGLVPLADPAEVLPADLPAYAATVLPPGPLTLVGDAVGRGAEALGPWPDLRVVRTTGAAEAAAVARLAAELPLAEIAARPADPYYLRLPDVTLAPPRPA